MKHTVKKLSSLFLALSLAAGLCLTPALAAETNYADAQASWAASSIERWSSSGIVKGDGNGNFNPDAPLSRAELAQIFVNMLGLTKKAENTFGDLMGDQWYADAILKCVAAGIMKGDGVNVNAEANISRAETIVMFGRAVGVTPDAEPDLSKFSDSDSVAAWAAGYLAPLAKMGILSGGGDGTLNADGQIDRASTMALLDKSIAEYVSAPGEYKVDNANGFVIVNVAAKEGEVVISGTAAGVAVSAGTAEGKIVAKDLKADTIKVDGAAAVSVEGKSTVGDVVANATGEVSIAKGVTVDTVTANSTGTVANAGTVNSIVANGAATVSNTGTVKELVANAPATVDNKGTITKAEVKADGVVLDGKKPTTVTVDEGTKNPTNSDGKEVKPGTDKPSGGYNPSYTDMIWVRPDGHDVAYNTLYNAVGATVTTGTSQNNTAIINVDASKLYNADHDVALVHDGKIYVGLQFNTPSSALGAKVKIGEGAAEEIPLNVEGDNAFGGKYVQYFWIADVNKAPRQIRASETINLNVEWYAAADCTGEKLSTTDFTVKINTTNADLGGEDCVYNIADLSSLTGNVKLLNDVTTKTTLVINSAMVFDGNNKTVTASNDYAIQAYNAGNVTLKDIAAVGAKKGAILVNGSTVTLAGTVTVTGAQGGIEVGQGVGVTNPGVLNIVDSATLVHAGEAANKPTVWMDSADKGTVNGGNLSKFTQESGKVYYFLDAANSGAEAAIGQVCYKTVADAITAAAPGNTVTLLDDITIGAPIAINKAITLDGAGKTITPNSFESLSDINGLLKITAGATVKDLTLNGNNQAVRGVYVQGDGTAAAIDVGLDTVTIQNCVLSNSASSNPVYSGAAIRATKKTINLTLTDCTIENNTAGGSGGAISFDNVAGNLSLEGCTIQGNKGGYYAGGIWTASTSEITVNLTENTITGNTLLDDATTYSDCGCKSGQDIFINSNSYGNGGATVAGGTIGYIHVEGENAAGSVLTVTGNTVFTNVHGITEHSKLVLESEMAINGSPLSAGTYVWNTNTWTPAVQE